MSRPLPSDPFLRGNYAPWPMEGDIHDLVVHGALPPELHGTLYRTGPNPQYAPRGRYHWFDGDGMVHALRFDEGRVGYRNRWVRTERFELERRAGEALFGGLLSLDRTDPRVAGRSPNAANTNIVWHAGRLLALWEGGPPYEMDPVTLETRGLFDFDGRLEGAMTAHPKTDPETGEMLMFGYSAVPPYVRYHVVSADGNLARSVPIQTPFPSMVHDFIVTRDHAIFPIFPAVITLRGGALVEWDPDRGTHVGIMPRGGGTEDVVWFELDPCYVFHPLNAHTEGDRVVADVARYGRLPLFDPGTTPEGLEGDTVARLTRWTFDLAAGTAKEEPLDDLPIEFPRVDERRAGLSYRHGFAGTRLSNARNGPFNAIVHYDLRRGERRVRDLGPSTFTSEPVFVPRSPQAPEGDGFLLAVVYLAEENRSDLLVLEAGDLESPPVASVHLPHRVPYGFHGNFAPAG